MRGEIDEARKVFDMICLEGCEPDLHSYNVLINGYCDIKRLVEAAKIFEEMSSKGLTLDVVTYNSLIGVFVNWGELGMLKISFTRCKWVGNFRIIEHMLFCSMVYAKVDSLKRPWDCFKI